MTRFESGARETENDLRAEIRVAKRRGNGCGTVWEGGRLAGKDVGTEYDRLDGQTGMEFFCGRSVRFPGNWLNLQRDGATEVVNQTIDGPLRPIPSVRKPECRWERSIFAGFVLLCFLILVSNVEFNRR